MLMLLEPGEVFEHAHAEPSTTTLVEGDVEFTVNGALCTLVPDEDCYVPAYASHVLVNRGDGPAIVRCGHLDVVP